MFRRSKETKQSMFLIAFGVVLYVLLQNISSVSQFFRSAINMVQPITAGLIIAYVLNVFMSRLERLLMRSKKLTSLPRFVRGGCILVCILVTLGIVALTLLVLVPKLAEGVQLIISLLPQAGEQISGAVTGLLTRLNMEPGVITNAQAYISTLTTQLTAMLRDSSTSIAAYFMSTLLSAASTLYTLVMGFMLAVYTLYHKEKISRMLSRVMTHFLPEGWKARIVRVARLSHRMYSDFVEGQLLQALILAGLCYVTMLIFHFPHAAVIALLSGVCAVIPIVGGYISGFVGALLIVATSPASTVWFILYFMTLQQLVGTFIYPRVVGQQMGLPSMLVLCAIIIGQSLGGIWGILFFVPLSAVLYALLKLELKKPRPDYLDSMHA